MPAANLVAQTTYAELLERCAAAAFSDAFPEDGAFTSKTIKGRRYWYFQSVTAAGRSQRYVGPESPQLIERIARHRQARDDQRERRSLVSALVRSYGLPAPLPQIGKLVAALATAGVFRLRGVLIGTVAYQCYPAMLGHKLPRSLLQTIDVDIAQFTNVSVATGDKTAHPMLAVLQGVDKTFHEVPHAAGHRFATSYAARGGLRVDFLTPNEGPDTDTPRRLPALQTDAQPLRFLDFLIHDPAQAVLLHGAGVYVQVPAPERYAVHKLILALDRPAAIAKRDKDLQQAGQLIEALIDGRSEDLKQAWEEAHGRGPKWRALLLGGMRHMAARSRDLMLKAIGRCRAIIPEIDLTFRNPPVRYDSDRELVRFVGESLGSSVDCAISREALEDHFGANSLDSKARIEAFQKYRSRIEGLLRSKYLHWPVDEPESLLLATGDVAKLLASIGASRLPPE
ncbi:MAG TPA: GSU2403 family nucleotidyltransferase fold protein [Steroidobacteraceae bacterium]|nr:GSU2403 family nucleotidyltransferase fold protein [Steroidobacteraceae bacterium]